MLDDRLPIVTYWFRGVPRSMGLGYLLERDGQHWCFPNEELAKTQAFPSGGFQLDQSHLQEQPDTGSDRKLYLYLKEVERDQQAPQTPPQQSVGFQQRVY